MKEEELPEYLQKVLRNLGHGSGTIDYDITDALYNANCVEDFRDRVCDSMNSLISEAECVKKMVVDEEEKGSTVHKVLTIDEAQQIACETLRCVATLHGWENFKDLVGRELDITDEIIDKAAELLFSEEKKNKKGD